MYKLSKYDKIYMGLAMDMFIILVWQYGPQPLDSQVINLVAPPRVTLGVYLIPLFCQLT